MSSRMTVSVIFGKTLNIHFFEVYTGYRYILTTSYIFVMDYRYPRQQLIVVCPCLFFYRIEYLELGNFEVVGLSTFVTNLLSFNVLQLKISLNLTFPIQVKAKHSNFTIIVGDLLPFKGEGPAK